MAPIQNMSLHHEAEYASGSPAMRAATMPVKARKAQRRESDRLLSHTHGL